MMLLSIILCVHAPLPSTKRMNLWDEQKQTTHVSMEQRFKTEKNMWIQHILLKSVPSIDKQLMIDKSTLIIASFCP